MFRTLRVRFLVAVLLFASALADPADALTRRGTASAGRISAVAIVALSTNFVVTAVRDADGFLRLISWEVASDGSLSRRDTVEGEQAGLISMSRLGTSRFATAIRDENGKLRLTAWDMSSDGTFRRLGTIGGEGPGIRRVSISNRGGIFSTAIYTGVRDESDRLHVTEWLVSRAGLITFVADRQGDSISEISVSSGEGDATVLAAVRDPDGRLALAEWSGSPIELHSDPVQPAIPGEVGELATVSARTVNPDASFTNIWLIAVSDHDGNLRLIAWDRELRRRRAVAVGAASQIGLATSGLRVFTAMRDGDGNLRVISWNLFDDRFLRHSTSTAGPIAAASKVAVAAISPYRVVTAMRDLDSNLRLIVWDDD